MTRPRREIETRTPKEIEAERAAAEAEEQRLREEEEGQRRIEQQTQDRRARIADKAGRLAEPGTDQLGVRIKEAVDTINADYPDLAKIGTADLREEVKRIQKQREERERHEAEALAEQKRLEHLAAQRHEEPVDYIPSVLDEAHEELERLVVLPEWTKRQAVLWACHTHCHQIWNHTPRLLVTSEDEECGKSTLLSVVRLLFHDGVKFDDVSPAALAEEASKGRTVCIDEIDNSLSKEMVTILNGGYGRDGMYRRGRGKGREELSTSAPVAMGGLAKTRIPTPTESRCIKAVLRRKRPDQEVGTLDADARERLGTLRRKVARLAHDNRETLAGQQVTFPDGITGRLRNNWRHLLAIAQAAVGDWAEHADAALQEHVVVHPDTEKQRLLRDLHRIFSEAGEFHARGGMQADDIVQQLIALEDDQYWNWRGRHRPVTKYDLREATGIPLKPIRKGGKVERGYRVEDLADVWERLSGIDVTPLHPLNSAACNAVTPNSDGTRKPRVRQRTRTR